MKNEDVLQLVEATETPQIRVGETHRFKDIWIVVVDGRLFCRQYMLGDNNGWREAFKEEPNGAIKCGDTVINVTGATPDDLDEINSKINAAYLKKYGEDFPDYPDIAKQMTGPEYMKTTTELTPVVEG